MKAQQLEQAANDVECIKVMKSLFQGIAYVETVRSVIETKQKEVITFYQFKVAKRYLERRTDKEFISGPKDMFLMSDEDFKIYLAEMETFYYSDECPFKPSKKGNCPLLEAESFLRDLKWEIVAFFEPITGLSKENLRWNLKAFDKYIDILLGLYASKVKEVI
jgi:hypothetical protein